MVGRDNGDPPTFYRNDADQLNAFLKVQLHGRQSNRDGIGAFVTLIADLDGTPQMRYVSGGGTNYLFQSDMTVQFGLGPRTQPIHQLIIDSRMETTQVFSDFAINTALRAVEPIPEATSAALLLRGAACPLYLVNRGHFAAACAIQERCPRIARLSANGNGSRTTKKDN